MSWAYWYSGYNMSARTPPLVSAYKAITGGRHLVHICERTNIDHTDGIHQAFFNGAGFESWENVWGIWNGITERHSELLRGAATILRWAGELVLTEDWIPHIPVTPEGSSVYASQFTTRPVNQSTTRLWLLVNRGLEDKDQELRLPCSSASATWIDLYHGTVMEDWICNEDE